MNTLKVGDKIIDLAMTEKHGKIVTPKITQTDKIKGITKRIVCFDPNFPNNYPHAFYDFEEGFKWEKLEDYKL